MVYSISSQQLNSLERITAAQLLPIAATIVAAGTGSEIAAVLPNPQHALGTVVTCYVLWGMGVPLAMTVLVLYYHRLAVHKLPPREIIVSSFLPLGPLGFGGYTYDVANCSTASRRIANAPKASRTSAKSVSHCYLKRTRYIHWPDLYSTCSVFLWRSSCGGSVSCG